MIKITFKSPVCDTPEKREDIAQIISLLLGRGLFSVHKPNISDDCCWTLDWDNNWKIIFYKDRPAYCEIKYRYSAYTKSAHKYETALVEVFKSMLDVEIEME